MNIKKLNNALDEMKSSLGEAKSPFPDEIGEFWVVTKPSKVSVLEDILFKSDVLGMHRQFLGGLKPGEIIGLFKSESKAKKQAQNLLGKIK